ncbi:UDP-glucose/GDP-mannose dehydrogenase family protein [Paenibacillus sp. CGMCC 1.16610]|uniref:UDP-glucose 6-dehydrogenase n=1 Tax=Paenibacillus anseongense TaxID=2682845 RepID=A0ABW9UHE2_9BACL|nr:MULTISPECIES: UDP-glucose/GDP-mannose dehydrogenase family protein [Paenibacillus]MBA2938499.1 UDP-glucose/GDP-mannose dehydrogenase family protein [Paenibacillus sp. CGMCC 1.16610]MVQ39617.1 nucleotide sugar dehydrogenase [Paenibacillus anseongense]
MKICMIGTGYVGLVVGACLAEMGHEVICVDNNPAKISALLNGQLPIYEPGLERLVERNVLESRLSFSLDISESVAQSQFIFIAVGTPPAEDGSADLTYVMKAVEQIGASIRDYAIVITKSTVPIGSSERIRGIIEEQLKNRGLTDLEFDIVSNPEFLREGAAVNDFLNPNRIVVGSSNPRALAYMEKLYLPLTSKGFPIVHMDIASAELAKYASNAMLATRISFMNEMAGICEAVGADIERVRQGMELDHRIGSYFLSAGVGYGGSCFPKDVRAIIQSATERNIPTHILEAVDKVNHKQKQKLFEMVVGHFGEDLKGLRLAVWGLSFKPETDDIREAPSIETIEQLRKRGVQIQVHDPVALQNAYQALGEENITYFTGPYQALMDADALLIFTEWKQYRSADLGRIKSLLKQPVLFDGRNLFNPYMMKEEGFVYQSIGRMK